MRKFKLTDVEGKEFILSVNEEKVGNILTGKDVFISPVTPEPEIKVGMWMINDDWRHEDKVFRIEKTLPDKKVVITQDFGSYTEDIRTYTSEDFRPATPAEIEAHLKKVCEKYVGKKIKGLVMPNSWSGVIIDGRVWYEVSEDTFWMKNGENYWCCVYQKGKFAEILTPKKKRPETREEFYEFLDGYIDRNCTRENFLDQYEL